MERWRENLKHL
jgi:hypothetical protein